jgi:hypothetical protein
MYAILNLNFYKRINMPLVGSSDFMQQAVKLVVVSESKFTGLRDRQSVSGYDGLCMAATKIQNKILEERKC